MSRSYIVCIDQGTTGTTAVLFDSERLENVASAKQEFKQIYPQPGWVEHDPKDILASTQHAVSTVLSNSRVNSKDLLCVAITNQRETVAAWNKVTGEPACNAIVWQDRRTSQFCSELKNNKGMRTLIFQKTGLVCDPYFSGSKIRWLMQNNDNCKKWAQRGELCIGTIDAYLMFVLTGGVQFVTEHTNACRTMLYNIRTGEYDNELLELFEVKKNFLPQILSSTSEFGTTVNALSLPAGLPIRGCLGDQQAALFGQRCEKPGEAKITFGTGAFLLMHTGSTPAFSNDGLLTTVAYSAGADRQFAMEGAAFIAGAAIQFLRDNFGWFKDAAESEALASRDPRDANVVFVPAFAGLGSPYWNPNAKATLFGLTRGTTQSQITRAVLESVALQNVQLLRLMETASQLKLKKVGVDGKAALNNMLMQFQADVLAVTLTRPKNIETTALGAARAARAYFSELSTQHENDEERYFKPAMPILESTKIVEQWERAARAVHSLYSQ